MDCLSHSSTGITPSLLAASNTAIAPSVLSPSLNPPWDSTASTVASISALWIASFKSSPIIILAQVPTIPTSFGENIDSTSFNVSSSLAEAPKIKSFSDMAVVTTLTPSFSRSLPVLKQQPWGP